MSDGAPSPGRPLLGQVLKTRGVIRESQVQAALGEQRTHGGLIGQALVEMGACTAGDIALALAEQAGMETVDLNRERPTEEAIAAVDGSTLTGCSRSASTETCSSSRWRTR